MSNCVFCKIIEKKIPAEVVYEDEHCIAFKDIHPKAAVHLLVIPRIHVESLSDLTLEHSDIISHMMLKLSEIAESQGLGNGFRTIVNTLSGGGQEVYHLHFHLLGGALKAF